MKAISQSKEKFSHSLMRLSGSGLIKLTMINRGLRGLLLSSLLSLLLFLVLMKKLFLCFCLLFLEEKNPITWLKKAQQHHRAFKQEGRQSEAQARAFD